MDGYFNSERVVLFLLDNVSLKGRVHITFIFEEPSSHSARNDGRVLTKSLNLQMRILWHLMGLQASFIQIKKSYHQSGISVDLMTSCF